AGVAGARGPPFPNKPFGCWGLGAIKRSFFFYFTKPRRCAYDCLIRFWQLIPLCHIDKEMVGRTAFPPARVVIKLGDLVEPKFLVVVRPDPLARVDCPFFQRWIDIAPGDLLR